MRLLRNTQKSTLWRTSLCLGGLFLLSTLALEFRGGSVVGAWLRRTLPLVAIHRGPVIDDIRFTFYVEAAPTPATFHDLSGKAPHDQVDSGSTWYEVVVTGYTSRSGFWATTRESIKSELRILEYPTADPVSAAAARSILDAFVAEHHPILDDYVPESAPPVAAGSMKLVDREHPLVSGYVYNAISVVLLLGAVLLCPWTRALSRTERHRVALAAGRCPSCGYTLSGLTRGRCPECGASVPNTRAAS